MKMASILCVLSIIISSCSSGEYQATSIPRENPPALQKLNQNDAWVIYRTILTEVRQNSDLNGAGSKGLGAKDPLVYRLETIPAPDVSIIADQSDVSIQLRSSFVQANQNPVILEKSYDVLDWTEAASVSPDINEFFFEMRRKNPNTKAVLNISSIGIAGLSAIAYVEYYSEVGGLRKAFLLLEVERSHRDENKLVAASIVRTIAVE